MLTEREEMMIAYLKRVADEHYATGDYEEQMIAHGLRDAADRIERGEHLKRPDPSIPYETWRDEPSVG